VQVSRPAVLSKLKLVSGVKPAHVAVHSDDYRVPPAPGTAQGALFAPRTKLVDLDTPFEEHEGLLDQRCITKNQKEALVEKIRRFFLINDYSTNPNASA